MTEPGDVIADRYRLVRQVATGGMGSVWEAWDELLHRQVAIKELLPQPGLSKDDAATARSRVIREARITARLHHPHAVTLYDVVEHRGQPCLILQYVPSRTLNSILEERGLLQVPFMTGVGAEVASALAAAHHVGIVHRDVKPSNVLITPSGSAMITDFGISHAAGDVSLTSTGMVTGTPAFLAPEVARGAASGYPADVFSLGATLYAALEGAPPFGRDQNAMAILHKVASGEVIPPRRAGELTGLLGHMLATDPASRPSMSEVARQLTQRGGQESAASTMQSPQVVAAPGPTIRERPTDREPPAGPERPMVAEAAPAASTRIRHSRRRRVAVLLTAAAVLVLVGLGAWLLIGTNSGAHPDGATRSAGLSSSAPRTTASALEGAGKPALSSSSTPTTATSSSTSASTTRATVPTPSTSRPPVATTTVRSTTTKPAVKSASPTTHAGSGSARSGAPAAAPTPAQLASAITDYYALLPGDTNQGWTRLTNNFRSTTAQNRQYYQRFWDGVQRVTATDAHGASPDTAEATITYYFKDGRIAVEPTTYSLVQQGGLLKIDSSTVLSSTTQ